MRQKRQFLHWIKFLIEHKNSKNFPTTRCHFISVCLSPLCLGSLLLFNSLSTHDSCVMYSRCNSARHSSSCLPCTAHWQGKYDMLTKRVYFLFSRVRYTTGFWAHLCLQLCDDDRGVHSLQSVFVYKGFSVYVDGGRWRRSRRTDCWQMSFHIPRLSGGCADGSNCHTRTLFHFSPFGFHLWQRSDSDLSHCFAVKA